MLRSEKQDHYDNQDDHNRDQSSKKYGYPPLAFRGVDDCSWFFCHAFQVIDYYLYVKIVYDLTKMESDDMPEFDDEEGSEESWMHSPQRTRTYNVSKIIESQQSFNYKISSIYEKEMDDGVQVTFFPLNKTFFVPESLLDHSGAIKNILKIDEKTNVAKCKEITLECSAECFLFIIEVLRDPISFVQQNLMDLFTEEKEEKGEENALNQTEKMFLLRRFIEFVLLTASKYGFQNFCAIFDLYLAMNPNEYLKYTAPLITLLQDNGMFACIRQLSKDLMKDIRLQNRKRERGNSLLSTLDKQTMIILLKQFK